MTTTMQGDRPRDRLNHDWRCVRRPVVETVRNGRVTLVCQSCGASDDDHDGGEAA